MQPSEIRPEHIAAAMGLELPRLWALARNVGLAFREREMRGIGRKHRPIDPMYRWSKKLFRKLHYWIQRVKLAHPRAHGGVRGRSCFTSANEHLGRQCVWARDAANCYPSISPAEFQREMIALKFNADTAELLTLICTLRGSLPQGSPLSNDALNLFFWRIDHVLSSFCGQKNLGYSRVADDFHISGKNEDEGATATRLVEQCLAERGIQINERKRREGGFRRRDEKPKVHNILVHNRRGATICNEHRAEAIAVAERYLSGCKAVQPDSLEALALRRRTVTGWMHYCRQAQFSPARHIRRLLEAGDAAIRRKLKSLGISAYKSKWWLMTKKRNEPRRLAILWWWWQVARARAETASRLPRWNRLGLKRSTAGDKRSAQFLALHPGLIQ